MTVEVAVLGFPSLIFLMVSEDLQKKKKTRYLHQAFQTCGILVELEVQSCIECEQRTNTFNQMRVINSRVPCARVV